MTYHCAVAHLQRLEKMQKELRGVGGQYRAGARCRRMVQFIGAEDG